MRRVILFYLFSPNERCGGWGGGMLPDFFFCSLFPIQQTTSGIGHRVKFFSGWQPIRWMWETTTTTTTLLKEDISIIQRTHTACYIFFDQRPTQAHNPNLLLSTNQFFDCWKPATVGGGIGPRIPILLCIEYVHYWYILIMVSLV